MLKPEINSKAKIAAMKKVSANGYDLKSVGKIFQSDEEVVRLAVSRNGIALEFASEELRNNKEIAISAIINTSFAQRYVSESLQKDKDIVRIAMKKDAAERGYPSLAFASANQKEDKNAVLSAVTKNGYNLAFVADSLREDPDVIHAAYKQLGIKPSKSAAKDSSKKKTTSKKNPKPAVTEKTMSVEGTGVQMRFIEVSKKIFDRIIKKGILADNLYELVDDGGVEGGALFPLTKGGARVFEGNAELHFDNGVSDKSLLFQEKLALKIPSKVKCDILPDAKYIIVVVDQMEGVWARWESDTGFDPNLLDVSLDIHKLADGTVFPMLDVSYWDDDGTSGMDLSSYGTLAYALTHDGSCIRVEIL